MKRAPWMGSIRFPGGTLAMASSSAKLAPQHRVDRGPGKRPGILPAGPYCASTYVSISKTCPETCAFRDNGCYAQSGASRRIMLKLDRADVQPRHLAVHEHDAMEGAYGRRLVPQDGARGGRDLRLHVGGDARDQEAAAWLSNAAARWGLRGGGAVWTYTHRWREIPAGSWGEIAVWASCETTAQVREAHQRSYRAALVVAEHPSERMYKLDGLKVLPCPYETRKKTCVECRLCLDAPIDPRVVIGFAVHGGGEKKARRRLAVLS
jgi:hypothetical protein